MQRRYDWRWVQKQAARTADLWLACRNTPPTNGARFSNDEQNRREAAYDAALNSVESELRRTPVIGAERKAMRDRVVAAFGVFSATALDLEPDAIEVLTRDFLPVGTTLARWTRRFDPALDMADIIQACRNAWTACGLQPLLGERVQITPAILGYSLLYPYSDNYLDERNISIEIKLQFSGRFRQRLRGASVDPANDREKALWRLIELIESQFERSRFPEVYNCLLSIHRAQEQSISQQLQTAQSYQERETLMLSCQKGGSSVLADACLANGYLSEEESRFAFAWGVLLQLGDDLQDVREDLRRGSMTLFSHAASCSEPLDALVVQLLQFAEHIGQEMDRLPHGSTTLKTLLKMSWRSLIIHAVADAHQFFSHAFVREAERCSPFRFKFLRERQNRLAARRGVYGMLFEALIQDDKHDQGEDWRVQPHVCTPAAVCGVPSRTSKLVSSTLRVASE